jgi:hypothetical protein
MDGNGVSFKPAIQGYILLVLGPLNKLEDQRLEREKIELIPSVGDIWTPSDVTILGCCVQFYKIKLDDRIKIGDHILRITHINQVAHLLCWIYSRDFYGKLCWRYVRKNDMN